MARERKAFRERSRVLHPDARVAAEAAAAEAAAAAAAAGEGRVGGGSEGGQGGQEKLPSVYELNAGKRRALPCPGPNPRCAASCSAAPHPLHRADARCATVICVHRVSLCSACAPHTQRLRR